MLKPKIFNYRGEPASKADIVNGRGLYIQEELDSQIVNSNGQPWSMSDDFHGHKPITRKEYITRKDFI